MNQMCVTCLRFEFVQDQALLPPLHMSSSSLPPPLPPLPMSVCPRWPAGAGGAVAGDVDVAVPCEICGESGCRASCRLDDMHRTASSHSESASDIQHRTYAVQVHNRERPARPSHPPPPLDGEPRSRGDAVQVHIRERPPRPSHPPPLDDAPGRSERPPIAAQGFQEPPPPPPPSWPRNEEIIQGPITAPRHPRFFKRCNPTKQCSLCMHDFYYG